MNSEADIAFFGCEPQSVHIVTHVQYVCGHPLFKILDDYARPMYSNEGLWSRANDRQICCVRGWSDCCKLEDLVF